MSHRDDVTWVRDVLEVAANLVARAENISYEDYSNDPVRQESVLYNLMVLGEASGQVSEEIKQEYDHIPWRDMTSLRNRVTRRYFDVDHEIVWEILTDEIPTVLPQIRDLHKKLVKT